MKVRVIISLIAFASCVAVAAAAEFADISPSTPHAEAIQYLSGKGILQGFSDDTIRPDHSIDRATFLKLLITLKYAHDDIGVCIRSIHPHFKDVPAGSWFAPYVCEAMKHKDAAGYADHTFHPGDTVTVGQAAKILSLVYQLPVPPKTDSHLPWYAPYIQSVATVKALPLEAGSAEQSLTRGEAAEMLWRLDAKVRDQPSADAATVLSATCNWFSKDRIPHVDIEEVRRVWISWINDARTTVRLGAYIQNKQLNYSATTWSLHAKSFGSISHKRTAQSAYYDYEGIKDWFASLDLTFANVDRKTFTENIGWGEYSCTKQDCTQALIKAIRPTFDFYMSEKGTSSDAHYRSIMDPEFAQIGAGIAVDAATGKYYLTTHYGTKITSDPDPICP